MRAVVVGDAMRAVVVGDAMRAVVVGDGMKTTAAFLDDTAAVVAVVTVAVAPDRLLCVHSASPLGRLRLRLWLRLRLRLWLLLRLWLRLRLLLRLYLQLRLHPPFLSL